MGCKLSVLLNRYTLIQLKSQTHKTDITETLLPTVLLKGTTEKNKRFIFS